MNLFTKGHTEFRTSLREYVTSNLTPHASEWEQHHECPIGVFRDMGQRGFLGLTQSPGYGGRGLDFGYNVILAEELPRSKTMGLVLSIMAQTNFIQPLLAAYGSELQKDLFLAPAIRGDKIGALASTEPAGGSDLVNATQCQAIDDGDYWVISGEKKYITNGPIADFIIALIRTKPEQSANSLSLIIVPTATPGFRVKETLRKLGLHTSPTGWLEFKECRVPKTYTLGKPNVGFFYHTQNLMLDRLMGGVCGISLASLVLQETMDYLRERVAFGHPLSRLQTIRHSVSEMAADIEMSQRFVHSVCESYRDGKIEAREICMIKLRVVEIVQRIVERCLQLHGASGFMEEHWIARAYRDVRALSVGGGASEVMKDLVAGYLRL